MEKSDSWLLTQTWENLIFFHWEMEPQKMAELIPPEFELDTYEGKAWMTVLPFKVRNQRFHGVPKIPLFDHYLELNVRTYVKYRGVPGVFFFSLDANHPLAVLGAKAGSLPYRLARMEMVRKNQTVDFNSSRIFQQAEFSVLYQPVSNPVLTVSGSLDYWLLERYCLFTKWGKWVLRGDIRHERWKVSETEGMVKANTVLPIKCDYGPSLRHYCPQQKAFFVKIKKV